MANHFSPGAFSPGAVGRWSIRRPWLAIAIWLAFVFVSIGLSIATGSNQLADSAVGQSARGDAQQNAHLVGPGQTAEIYLHSRTVPVTGASFKVSIAQVSAVMRNGFGGPVSVRIAGDRHSVLVVGQVERAVSPSVITSAVARTSWSRRPLDGFLASQWPSPATPPAMSTSRPRCGTACLTS